MNSLIKAKKIDKILIISKKMIYMYITFQFLYTQSPYTYNWISNSLIYQGYM